MRPRLLIATTVPETLVLILRDQPRFLAQHFEVNLVTSPGEEINILAHEGVPVHTVSMRRGISPLFDLISICQMVLLMLRLRPNIIHSYTPKAGLVCMVAAWVCRVPVRVHTFTGLIWPTTKGGKQLLLKIVDRLLCACATDIVPESAGVMNDLQEAKITNKQLKVIGYGNIAGVDLEHFSPIAIGLEPESKQLKQRYGIGDGDFVFVFVGRLNRDKGFHELVIAFKQLPDHCRLLVVGGVDKTAPINEQAMDALKSHPRIHWLGFQHDVRPALLAADVFVLPSYREGFPNVILQAGAMKLPVIATDISGCNEIITSNINGWLVPVKDVAMLALSMRSSMELSKLTLHAMGGFARERVLERFERGAHWRRMVVFYRELVTSARR